VTSAYLVSQKDKNEKSAEQAVIVAEREELKATFESKDSDGDGIPDWREDFDENVFETIDVPTPSIIKESDEPYEPPTTFTGKFAVAFMKDYLSGGINGPNFTDPTGYVDTAVNAIDQNTGSKRYTRLDFTIIDTSPVSLRKYGNTLGFVLQLESVAQLQEAIIFRDALRDKDEALLEELKPIQERLRNTLMLLLGTQVPSELSEEHVKLLNIYESMLTTIDAMLGASDDPLIALARMRNYTEDHEALFDTVQEIIKTLTQNDIAYSHTEPGAQLYLSDL
jgi:hypothetical protein